MEAVQLRGLSTNPPQDPNERRQLYEAARSLAMSLETPFDAMHRILWSVQQLPMTQVGVDMGIFRALATDSSKTSTLEELSAKTNVDRTLLYRVLRYLSSFGLIKESDNGMYCANTTTEWLATSGAEGGVRHYLKTISPVAQAIPEWLKEQNYQNPTNSINTAFQKAHQTDVSAYSWRPSDPTLIPAFFEFMKSQRASQRIWTDAFPVQNLKLSESDVKNQRVLFLDVGGASGHQCISLRQRHPELSGRIVLQDQERVVTAIDQETLKKHQIESMAHDFFQRQPIKGAKSTYLRNVLHDWPDDKCVEILTHIRDAMSPDSVLLIDENVLPDVGASWKQAQKDIQMMSALAAVERSVSQWKELLHRAGLKIKQIHTYDDDIGDSIIEAIRA